MGGGETVEVREEHTYQRIQQNSFGVQRSPVRIPVSTIYYLVALGIVPDLSDPPDSESERWGVPSTFQRHQNDRRSRLTTQPNISTFHEKQIQCLFIALANDMGNGLKKKRKGNLKTLVTVIVQLLLLAASSALFYGLPQIYSQAVYQKSICKVVAHW